MDRIAPPLAVDASRAECLVFTRKQGLLSRVAHDLKLRVTDFALAWDGETLTGRFDPGSLRVVAAMTHGREDPAALDADAKAQIERNIATEVLHAERFPSIDFRSSRVTPDADGVRITGDLNLHGVTRRITASVKRQGDRWLAEVPIHQPDYEIRPYAALLGALKVAPGVRVVLSVPARP